MRDLVVKSNGLDLARGQTRTPFPVLRFSLGQRFAILTAHDRRHLQQTWESAGTGIFPFCASKQVVTV